MNEPAPLKNSLVLPHQNYVYNTYYIVLRALKFTNYTIKLTKKFSICKHNSIKL